jgi:hypothetical protein
MARKTPLGRLRNIGIAAHIDAGRLQQQKEFYSILVLSIKLVKFMMVLLLLVRPQRRAPRPHRRLSKKLKLFLRIRPRSTTNPIRKLSDAMLPCLMRFERSDFEVF